MATIEQIKKQIEDANALGRQNLEKKGITTSGTETTYQIMSMINSPDWNTDVMPNLVVLDDLELMNTVTDIKIRRQTGNTGNTSMEVYPMTIGDGAFQGFRELKNFVAPVIESIGNYAFYLCSSLEMVDIPKVTHVGASAFAYCTSLNNIAFNSDSPVTLDEGVFVYCRNLRVASFKKCPTLGDWAFNTSGLRALIIQDSASTPTELGLNVFQATPIARTTEYDPDDDWKNGYIYVPSKKVGEYQTIWSDFSDKIRALQDYTIDGSLEGDLINLDKILYEK